MANGECKLDAELVDAEVIARRFGVTVATVLRWARDGRIPYLRPSRRVIRFRLAEVEQALALRASGGAN